MKCSIAAVTARFSFAGVCASIHDAILLVLVEEPIDVVAVAAQRLVDQIVGTGVAAFLAEESLDLTAQHRVIDPIEEVLHRSDEEPLAVRK